LTRRIRRYFFFISGLALIWVFVLAYGALPPTGSNRSQYGDTVNSVTVRERHITDAVTAVNFDVRGFDTLGEEFIMFTSVIGTVLLMRRQGDEPTGDHEDKLPDRAVPPASDAVRAIVLLLVGPTVLFGLYIVSHGQITPGGGFQGGVILASAPVLLYLGSEYDRFHRAVPYQLVETSDAIGAATYILVGGACVALGGVFLQNLFPLGQSGSLTGGGMVVAIDLGVGLEVGGGLSLALLSYLQELVQEKES
jgi:multicomponent Na+:H+ antiporter subunit B